MCDDVQATVDELEAKGVPMASRSATGLEPADGDGLPGGDQLGLYEPRHPADHQL